MRLKNDGMKGDTFWVMHIVESSTKDTVAGFWRTYDAKKNPEERAYKRVYLDTTRKDSDGTLKEDWRNDVEALDSRYTSWNFRVKPIEVIYHPFELTKENGYKIPLAVWDRVQDFNIPFENVGGPAKVRTYRGKK